MIWVTGDGGERKGGRKKRVHMGEEQSLDMSIAEPAFQYFGKFGSYGYEIQLWLQWL